MANLCKMCKNLRVCIEEGTADECVDNDFINYSPISDTCDGCFYEDWDTSNIFSPCRNCIRMPKPTKKDYYVSKEYEREEENG